MSIQNTVEISQVEPDIDPLLIAVVKNPLKKDFTHDYDGKPQTIPAEGEKQAPLYLCVHLAKHLAEKIIRAENRNRISGIKDEKVRYEEERKAIPNYQGKIWELMKKLVVTDSSFFKDTEKKQGVVK